MAKEIRDDKLKQVSGGGGQPSELDSEGQSGSSSPPNVGDPGSKTKE